MYRERPSAISRTVLWTLSARTGSAVLPDGCMDLLWLDDDLVVAGPDTEPQIATPTASTAVPEPLAPPIVALRFGPGIGPSVFGVPADELCNQRVSLRELWPAGVCDRHRREVAARPASGLESLALSELSRRPVEPCISQLASWCAAGEPIERLTAMLGWSERTLRRRSRVAFGYGPKTLHRVLRLHRTLGLIRAGGALAEIAGQTGYADQAHLTREVTALTGRSPTRHAR